MKNLSYPQHLAIIPDGNRTRAKHKNYPTLVGHKAWFDNMVQLAQHIFSTTSIRVMTFRWLSTENTAQRSPDELEYLYGFAYNLENSIKELLEQWRISFRRIGSRVWLPSEVIDILDDMKTKFCFWTEKMLVVAVNYGGRDEIIRWVNKWLAWWNTSIPLTEESLSKFMDCTDVPPIDLVIRTKSHLASRLSGFMLWWIGYAELFFSELLFPDFTTKELDKALVRYDERVYYRNFGK